MCVGAIRRLLIGPHIDRAWWLVDKAAIVSIGLIFLWVGQNPGASRFWPLLLRTAEPISAWPAPALWILGNRLFSSQEMVEHSQWSHIYWCEEVESELGVRFRLVSEDRLLRGPSVTEGAELQMMRDLEAAVSEVHRAISGFLLHAHIESSHQPKNQPFAPQFILVRLFFPLDLK